MSVTLAPKPARMLAPPHRPLPLQNGDRMTRDEFERRYNAMPEVKKAELIEGVVYMPSPVRTDYHGEPHTDIITWAGSYRVRTPGVRASDNGSIRLDTDNMPQPDVQLFLDPTVGGQARLGEDGYLESAPELIIEVAASSASSDLHDKLNSYLRNGVQEYIIWRIFDREIDWFRLREGNYERLLPGEDGIHRSEVFPGLWLDAHALIGGNLLRVHEVLAEGLASPEHESFVRHHAATD